ncbi:MAG TPA: ATPase domain-containing protein [Tahibacter sp.]|uniref:ATPase domain-containing protein n=1 Tax=Tahibacter sp. TaxID=2056211 RepID=UPI002BDFB7C7|nr:ATPase domain-containing protein [Tahibacter sp.]HSX61855.1 ATPase domain-containing protein [Tahibacter sp.]
MSAETPRISSGISGLDIVLRGGLAPHRLYLVEGAPGSGKTTLALQFLLDGIARNERGLYVTLSETTEELVAVAQSHGWNLDALALFELANAEEMLGVTRDQSVLHPWELELGGTIRLIQEQVEAVKPARVVFDSLSELRLLAQDPLRYRRQVLALKQYFAGRNITVLLLDDLSADANSRDAHLHSLCHGVITLERVTPEFGTALRRLEVQKLRGIDFVAGFHDLRIRRGGIEVYPRLIAADHHRPFVGDAIPSGVPELDALLGGGPLRGTCTLLTGPAGSGKTTISLQYVYSACERGEPCAIFEFDERVGTLLTRAHAMGLDLGKHIESRRLGLYQVDPAQMSPGQLATRIRETVEDLGCRVIVIDSIDGYYATMSQSQQLILQMHELLSYLNQQGVVTFVVHPQTGLVGNMTAGTLNISYVADAVILTRFFEADGRIRKAISVIKNRGGSHEDSIRELRIDAQGVRVGAPLVEFRGVMTGTPEYVGSREPLMEDRNVDA